MTAGEITRKNFALGMKREWKSDETPLTVTDTEINNLVAAWLKEKYPEVSFIGEEGSNIVDGAKYSVFCDPVDGTIPFSLGLPISTFCISVFEDGKPIIGVIYDPFQNRMWSAEKGMGSWLDIECRMSYWDHPEPELIDWSEDQHFNGVDSKDRMEISVSPHSTVNRSNICMIWWKGSPYHLHDACKLLMDAGGHWINPASLAIFGGLIASGTIDGSIFPGKHAWETGAMQVIVEEAGGKVTDIHGNPMVYGPKGEIEGHIVSNGLIHDQLVELVAQCQGVP
jgi:histidinol-phosphatase